MKGRGLVGAAGFGVLASPGCERCSVEVPGEQRLLSNSLMPLSGGMAD